MEHLHLRQALYWFNAGDAVVIGVELLQLLEALQGRNVIDLVVTDV